MTVRSFGTFILQSGAVYNGEQPASALDYLILRNNIQHLADVSCHYKINWVASTASSEVGGGGEIAGAFTYDWGFPISNLDLRGLVGFDLRVGVRLTGTLAGATVTARLMPIGSNAPKDIVKIWDITSAPSAWNDHDWNGGRPWGDMVKRIPYIDPAAGTIALTGPGFIMGQLSVHAIPDDPTDGAVQIVGVSLREYLLP